MKIRLFILLSFIATETFCAQTKNIFHDRNFWKQNPSIATIEEYIEKGHNISALNANAFDAVTWALIEKTDNETVKDLLSKDGNGVNKLTHDGRTYIFWAAYKDNLEMMQYLVARGAKTDIVDSHGYSVLNFAATTGQTNTKLYDFIFEHGADIKTEKNHDGANALLLVAPFLKDIGLVEYFISKGADLNATDNNGNGIFNYATKGGNIEMLKLLMDKGLAKQSKKAKNSSTMVMASLGTRGHQNTLELYEFLEKQGFAVNAVDHKGRNPLHTIASKTKNIALLNFFIQKGVDVSFQNEEGISPFMLACNSNNLDVVSFLSKHVKSINKVDKKGRSALTMAVNRNSIEVVRLLLEKGADASIKDKDGNNLMYYAMNTYKSSDTEAFSQKISLLKKHGVNISGIQGNGNTLYHIAVEKGNLDLVKHIKDFDINVNSKNNDGITALHLAAMKATDKSIMEYLISIGANKNLKTDFEESVYHLAKENELLAKNGVDLNFLK